MKTMTLEKRLFLKMAALFLRYPDENCLKALDSIQPLIAQLPGESGRDVLEGLLWQMKNTPLITLQEAYTGTFDLNQAATLYLTFHQWGEGRQRGQALARLNHLYQESGLESTVKELPDYLPMVLEFLSVCSDESSQSVIHEQRESLSILAVHLQTTGCIYSDLIAAVLKTWEGQES